MGNKTVTWAIAIIVLLMGANATAATRYVSDELSINMRRGPSTSYSITELLRAGTQVQTLEQTNGWTRIQTPEGERGYVLTRLLSTQPAASDRMAEVEAQLQQLKQENKDLRKELSQALHGSEKLGKLKRELVAENEALKAELKRVKRVSAHALKLNEQNKTLRKQLLAAQSELERLRSKVNALQSRREGMKIGALILVCGVILGLVLPMFRRRKNKGSWDSL